jgi:Tubulin binding cofactor C
VLTATGPTIEDSTDLRFCAWQATYPELQSQLDKIGLDVKKNAWDKVRLGCGFLLTQYLAHFCICKKH